MTEVEFVNKDEEAEFWKNKCQILQNELRETQEEFQNFEISSRDLENELELQLNDYESRNKNLIISNEKLSLELENFSIRFSDTVNNMNHQISDMQDEVSRLKNEKSTLQKYVRELEQTNDDLERGKRVTVMSLQDFEEKLNIAIEKNAILENELEEKESLVETVQRLKEEARDLRHDLQVKEMSLNQQVKKSDQDIEALATSMIEERDNSQMCHKYCQTDLTIPQDSNLSNGFTDSNYSHTRSSGHLNYNSRSSHIVNNPSYTPLTPAARISALNLVSDMLRKVGAIEHKLTSAAHRGLSESDSNYQNYGSRTPSRHRMSESVIANGFMRHTDNDAFESEICATPVASPVKNYFGFDKPPTTPLTQSVRE